LTASVRLSGRVETGQGVGASFTRTDWALGVFRDAYGVDPFPGTLNVRTDAGAATDAWQNAAGQGRLFKAPDPSWCDARCLRATIRRGALQASAVIVLPLIAGYPRDQVELVADRHLRETLALRDGDLVMLELEL
jgi:riboflavin kinase